MKRITKTFVIVVIIFCLVVIHTYPIELKNYKISIDKTISTSSHILTLNLNNTDDEVDSLVFIAQRKIRKKKSPELALVLALFPGFIIHGLGHFYAGKPLLGGILLVCGIVGTCLIIAGVIMIGVSGSLLGLGIILTAITGVDVGVSTGIAIATEAVGLIRVGGILFLGSWWVDIVGAPIACILRNQKIEKEQKTISHIPLLVLRF